MADRFELYFRAHTIPVKVKEARWAGRRAKKPKHALIFRCATTADEKQELLFGAYICAELTGSEWTAKEIGLFCQDGHPEELRVLQRFVKDSAYEMGTIEQFRRRVFLKYLKAGALIVAYGAPFEISRIAIKWNKSRKRRRAFSFYFRMFQDKKTGKMRPSGYEPGLSIESLDASKAIYRLLKYKFHEKDEREEEEKSSDVHILDLGTLTAALTGEAYTFQSACEIFGAPVSKAHKHRPRVTKAAIEHLLRDVTAELELLNRLSNPGQGLLFGNGGQTAGKQLQDFGQNQRDSYASPCSRPCGMHDQADTPTCHLSRLPCPVSGGEPSARLPGNTVRGKPRVCRLHCRGARVGGTHCPG
jgi:hypothetical protein